MKKLIFLILLVSFSCKDQGKKAADHLTNLSPSSFKEDVSDKKVQLVDVRTAEEFEEGHIEKAVNIDFLAEGFDEKFDNFHKDQPIYIYCRSGNRSGKAAKILSEMGFETIYDLEGGYLNFEKNH